MPRPLKWPAVFPLDKGLCAWYTFDDRSGAVLRDCSGKGNHGTLYGPTWVAGRRGSALSFDGTNDYVEVANSTSLRTPETTGEITLMVWVKPTVTTSRAAYIAKWQWDSVTGYGLAERIGKIVFKASAEFSETTSVYILSGILQHIAVTGKVSNGEVKFYYNGILKETKTATLNFTSTQPVSIGIRKQGMLYPLNGTINEVRIYNRALSATEIKRLYESELMLVRH